MLRGQQPGHVPVPRELRVPRPFRHVFAYLARVDRDLRIRRSIEHPGLFVLERRCRRRPAVNVSMHLRSDMHLQARDGYIHVSTVHPQWLVRPWNIAEALQNEGYDTWGKGAERIDDELRYEEAWAKETRRRRRRADYRAMALEQWNYLQRMGGEGGTDRFRINNAGIPVDAPAPATA